MKRITEILSAGRKAYLDDGSFESDAMQEVALFFSTVSESIFNSEFVWSEFNKESWRCFTYTEKGSEGGMVIFSFERDGAYPKGVETHGKLNGLGVGKPLGDFPYTLWNATKSRFSREFLQKLNSIGYTTDTTLTLD